jgi:hypothetical protein
VQAGLVHVEWDYKATVGPAGMRLVVRLEAPPPCRKAQLRYDRYRQSTGLTAIQTREGLGHTFEQISRSELCRGCRALISSGTVCRFVDTLGSLPKSLPKTSDQHSSGAGGSHVGIADPSSVSIHRSDSI